MKTQERRWEYLAKDLYSAILLFAFSLNKTIAKSNDSTRTSAIHNGSVVMAQARRMTFIGIVIAYYKHLNKNKRKKKKEGRRRRRRRRRREEEKKEGRRRRRRRRRRR